MSYRIITSEELEKYFSEENEKYNFLREDTYSITEINTMLRWSEKKVNRTIDAIFKGFGIYKRTLKRINPKIFSSNHLRREWLPLFGLCFDECVGEECILYNIERMEEFADYCFLFLTNYIEDNYNEPEILEWLQDTRYKLFRKCFENEKVTLHDEY